MDNSFSQNRLFTPTEAEIKALGALVVLQQDVERATGLKASAFVFPVDLWTHVVQIRGIDVLHGPKMGVLYEPTITLD